ncbi:hypothetical protein Bca4012_013858 [Brassica carinata]
MWMKGKDTIVHLKTNLDTHPGRRISSKMVDKRVRVAAVSSLGKEVAVHGVSVEDVLNQSKTNASDVIVK